MAMALRATAAIRGRPPPQYQSNNSKSQPSLPPHPPQNHHQKHPLLSSAAPAVISLLTLFSTPNAFCEAKAIAFSKEDMVSFLTKVLVSKPNHLLAVKQFVGFLFLYPVNG